jgi:hypothetical protein
MPDPVPQRGTGGKHFTPLLSQRNGRYGQLELTEIGQREIDKLVGATRRWLADELTDWGAGDDELLTRALDNMAKQFIDQDPQLLPAPEVPVAIGGRRENS